MVEVKEDVVVPVTEAELVALSNQLKAKTAV